MRGAKFFERRVVVVGIAYSHLRVGKVPKICEPSIYFLHHGVHVITHTQINGEVGTDAEVVHGCRLL